jgi:hypothetical protein
VQPSDLERLATLEQVARELPGDLAEIKHEQERARGRLHTLEASVQGLMLTQKEARRAEAAQYRRLELRLQRLALAVMAAGTAISLALAFAHGH